MIDKVLKKFCIVFITQLNPYLQLINTIFMSLPYLGEVTTKLRFELTRILEKRLPRLNCKLIFTNKYSIGSLYKHKGKLLPGLSSDLIYKFECSSCKASYIGSTTRHFQSRVYEHLAKSVRTEKNHSFLHPFHSSENILNHLNIIYVQMTS